MKNILIILGLIVFLFCESVDAGSYPYRMILIKEAPLPLMTVVGFFQYHVVGEKETLLDIARNYGLGFNEMSLFYPKIDPWIPKKGTTLCIPARWVLPTTRYEDVVVNIPEMRLYRFFKKYKMVKTYPVGIGGQDFETPVALSKVMVLEKYPSWTLPPSILETHGRRVVPPGPDNPLGDYWIGLSVKHIGIHGTDFPWSIGRQISRGCIRLYPEHIIQLFKEVSAGTCVEIVYEPVKIGVENHTIYMEVHPDVYNRIPDMLSYAEDLIFKRGIRDKVSMDKVSQCINEKNGVPVPVGTITEGGDSLTLFN
jgi:L,D-transpeptidase ErfK/SrfK